jgi:spore maturation protein CgeB
MNGTSPAFLREVRACVKLITGQIAYPIARDADLSEYDLILSSFPHFVERFRRDGLTSEYFNLGFEPKVLGQLKKQRMHYQTVFVGGLSVAHVDRIRLLEKIASSQALDVWGYGINALDSKSPVCNVHHGNAWALEMYNILYNSKIVLNNHISVAENYANNMRLYEATGVGAFLLTDYKDNLHTLFEPGKEVVAYSSAEECAELINYYLEHKEERKAIARAGQERTLAEHTYYERMKELVDIVHKYM